MQNDNNYITIKILLITRVNELMHLYFHWVSLIDLNVHDYCVLEQDIWCCTFLAQPPAALTW